MNRLAVDFDDERTIVVPGETLTFGRDAALVIDSSPFLHRQLGALRHSLAGWQLSNTGTAISLTVVDCNSTSRLVLTPETAATLPFTMSSVHFAAGGARYELRLTVQSDKDDDTTRRRRVHQDGDTTVNPRINLNDEQRLLLTALAMRVLERRALPGEPLPTNAFVAHQLGWNVTKLNRKLDRLCARFASAGISGLKGDLGDMAGNRRDRLIDHVLAIGLITEADLVLLPDAGASTP